ncbi:MAG TPA: hypothetical protein VF234_07240 [Limnochordia bacterium]
MRPRMTAEEREQAVKDARLVHEMMQHPGWAVLERYVREEIERVKEALLVTPGLSRLQVMELQKIAMAWRHVLHHADEIVEAGFDIERRLARKERS